MCTFALPPAVVSVAGLELVAEIQVVRGGTLRLILWHVGGCEVEGMLGQSLRMIGNEGGFEIQGVLRKGLIFRDEGGLEIEGVLGQSLGVIGHEARLEVE